MSLQEPVGEILSHDYTKTSKTLRLIEKQLVKDLDAIVAKIRIHINTQQPWYDISQKFKPIYGQQVYDLLRAGATDSYTLGNQYVTSLRVFVNVPSYLTKDDIFDIERLTQLYYDKFWGRVVASTSRRADKAFGIIDRMREPPDTFLNPNYIVTSIATTLTNHALNQATITKMRKLADKVNPITINRSLLQGATLTFEDDLLKSTGITLSTAVGLNQLNQIQNTVNNVKVMWVTSNDERTCPICKPLHGKKWILFDEGMPMPGVHSHQRCRCRLVIITPK